VSKQTKTLLAEVLKIAATELTGLGMHKTKGVYIYPMGRDVCGWLGLNVAANRTDMRLGINPVVGIRHCRIEKMLVELTREEETALTPTLSISLGYVSPAGHYEEWLFDHPPFDYKAECGRMVKAIDIYGIPFMKSNEMLQAIIENLEQVRFTTKDSVVYRLPVAYLLSGKSDAAAALATAYLEEVKDRSDRVAREYKTFAANLLRKATALASGQGEGLIRSRPL